MKRVGIVGGVSCDHLVRVGMGARFNQSGGPGIYAALSAAHIAGVQVALLSELPADDNHVVVSTLRQYRIEIHQSTRVPDVPRLWILDAPEGRRVIPAAVAPGEAEISPSPTLEDDGRLFQRTDLDDFDALLLCAPDHLPTLRQPAAGQIRGIDPDQLAIERDGWRYIEACCEWATVLIPSRVQLRQLGDDPLGVAGKLRERYGVDVVAKLDRDGAIVLPAEGGAWRVYDPAVQVVETTGAGDTLAGAVVAARARGDSWQQALALGVSAARLALSDWGIDGLLGAPASLDVFPEVVIEPLEPKYW